MPDAWYLPCPIAECGAFWYVSPMDDEKIAEMKADEREHWREYHEPKKEDES